MKKFRVDKYLVRQFNRKTYNCFDFVRDAWLELTGVDLGDQTPNEYGVEPYTYQALKVANTLKKLPGLTDPCIVLMLRPKMEPHVGIYHKGKVLHLNLQGAQFMPFDHVVAPFQSVSFYQ